VRLLIKGGNVIDVKTGRNGIYDILTDDRGMIAAIEKKIKVSDYVQDSECDVIDASGKYVLPGLVDAHCHLRDPGFEYKEDIESGTRSAAAGGFTSVACMPNTDPPADNQSVIRYIINKAKQEGSVNVFPIGTITKKRKGEELAEIGDLKFAGAVAISDDGSHVQDPSLMKKALQYASMFDITVISHCEDIALSDEGLMNEGYRSTVIGLKGIPSAAEDVAVARDIILAEYTGTPLHIAHVSTSLAVELIRGAKKRGVKVTAETCPHYFSITEDACDGFNTNAKVNPPLRTQKDVSAIIEGIIDGTIDIIATDHAPQHMDEKNVEFAAAAFGISGFETALPLVNTYLVKPGYIDMETVVRKMCYMPAIILGIDKGVLEPGKEADITIFDSNEEFVVDTANFVSKGKNSPFQGYKLKGTIAWTIVKGRKINVYR
jgi:dihydroorotase